MSEDEEDEAEDVGRARLKAKKAGKEEAPGGAALASPGKFAKAAGKGVKLGVSPAQVGLDVLATLVTAEANAKGGDSAGAMSMKAWLEMQVKNKLSTPNPEPSTPKVNHPKPRTPIPNPQT
jgi:hypothetical protein